MRIWQWEKKGRVGARATSRVTHIAFLCFTSDHNRGELQDLLSERGIQVFCGEPLHFCSLQASRSVHLRLRHQPVLHRHCQSVGGTHASSLPWRVQTRLLHHQLLSGLHHRLRVSGAREQSSRGQVWQWMTDDITNRWDTVLANVQKCLCSWKML